MIYSKKITTHVDFKPLRLLLSANLESDSVYWFDQHDESSYLIKFISFLDEKHWDHLRNDNTTKILLYYGDEYFNINDINQFAEGIKTHNINPSQVYLVTVDENWKNWAETMFLERKIEGINIQSYNALLRKTNHNLGDISDLEKNLPLQDVKKKFSIFSRNFNEWRFRLFAELIKRDLLSEFKYTFSNVYPYHTIPKIVDKTTIKNMSIRLGYDNPKILSWIDNMPYQFKESSVMDKWTKFSYFYIMNSDIHIVVESHFDPFLNDQKAKFEYSPDYFSPAFPTEKIYKALLSERPIIVFSTPYFLKELKQLGYKTFSPYIDESYDDIKNESDRLQAIVNEIERINNLDSESYKTLIDHCNIIAKENSLIIKEHSKKIKLNDKFSWIYQYMHEDIIKLDNLKNNE